MACRSVALPANGLQLAPRSPLTGPIRPPVTPAQIDVLKSCVCRRKYRQNVTVSPAGYPRGYITEPQQDSDNLRPCAAAVGASQGSGSLLCQAEQYVGVAYQPIPGRWQVVKSNELTLAYLEYTA